MEVIKRLKIKNFLGTRDREIDFSMYNNPIFIVGENAGGKTTIMRAIYMALTGEDAFFNSKKLDGLINDYAENMSIELDIVNKGKLYKISISKVRGKPLDIMIYENDVQIIKSSLTKEAKGKLSSLFGNPLAILSTYFIFGDNKSDFVDTTPTERLKIITKVSDAFQKYEKISETAKGFIKKLELEKNQLIGKLELASNNVKELQLKIDNFKYNEENEKKQNNEKLIKELRVNEKLKEQIEEIDKELNIVKDIDIDEIIGKIKTNKESIIFNKGIDEKVKVIEDNKKVIEDNINKFKLELNTLEGEKNTIKKEFETNKSFIKEINSEILSKYDKLEIDAINTKIENGKKVVEEKLEEGRKLKTQIEIIESDIKKIESELGKKNKELSDTEELFKHNKECPLCHNALKEDSLGNYKKFIEKEVENLNKEIEKLKKEITTKTELKNTVGKTYVEYSNILKELELVVIEKQKIIDNKKIETKIIELEKDLKIKETKIEEISLKLKKEESILKGLNEDINKLKTELKTILSDTEISRLEQIIDTNKKTALLKENKEKLEKDLNQEYKDLSLIDIRMKLKSIDNELNIINSNIATFNADKERIVIDIKKQEDIKISIEDLNLNIEEYENLYRLFGKDGIQKRQIQLLLGQIEMETNALVKKFFEQISVKFDYSKKGIDLKILRRVDLNNGAFEMKEDVIGNFSDAQQEVLKVLLKISFSKVVQNLNNTPLNILFLNETFNTLSADKEPLLVEILNYYSKFYHIGFITHNQELIENYSSENVYHIK